MIQLPGRAAISELSQWIVLGIQPEFGDSMRFYFEMLVLYTDLYLILSLSITILISEPLILLQKVVFEKVRSYSFFPKMILKLHFSGIWQKCSLGNWTQVAPSLIFEKRFFP